MAIIVTLDVMLARRKIRSKELAARVGITEQNISLLKSGKVKGIPFETLSKICAVLDCQHGDILTYEPDAGNLNRIWAWLLETIANASEPNKAGNC